jgi:hypothetical protein
MNVAFYDPARGGGLFGRETFEDCSRKEVQDMAMLIQINSMNTGHDLGATLLVAWDDMPENYIGIFTLSDLDSVGVLDKIESLISTRH